MSQDPWKSFPWCCSSHSSHQVAFPNLLEKMLWLLCSNANWQITGTGRWMRHMTWLLSNISLGTEVPDVCLGCWWKKDKKQIWLSSGTWPFLCLLYGSKKGEWNYFSHCISESSPNQYYLRLLTRVYVYVSAENSVYGTINILMIPNYTVYCYPGLWGAFTCSFVDNFHLIEGTER